MSRPVRLHCLTYEYVPEYVAGDPYVEAGLVVSHTIEPWTVVAHRPLED